jgi:hypothetical protein
MTETRRLLCVDPCCSGFPGEKFKRFGLGVDK